jgi:hypothetical protein
MARPRTPVADRLCGSSSSWAIFKDPPAPVVGPTGCQGQAQPPVAQTCLGTVTAVAANWAIGYQADTPLWTSPPVAAYNFRCVAQQYRPHWPGHRRIAPIASREFSFRVGRDPSQERGA